MGIMERMIHHQLFLKKTDDKDSEQSGFVVLVIKFTRCCFYGCHKANSCYILKKLKRYDVLLHRIKVSHGTSENKYYSTGFEWRPFYPDRNDWPYLGKIWSITPEACRRTTESGPLMFAEAVAGVANFTARTEEDHPLWGVLVLNNFVTGLKYVLTNLSWSLWMPTK